MLRVGYDGSHFVNRSATCGNLGASESLGEEWAMRLPPH
jgi:hypothetical protein